MRSEDIQSKSDTRSKNRVRTQSISAKLYKVDGNKVLYTVTSSTKNKQYIVTIQLLSLSGNKLRSLKSALAGDIRISCTCPGFLYQGYKYIAYKKQVGIDPENRSPDIRNPNKEGLACKHILAALNQMKRDYNSIYALFKQQPTKREIKPTDTKSCTENDVKIITDFKSACDNLYNSYTKYKNSGSDVDFIDSEYYSKSDNPVLLLSELSDQAKRFMNGTFISKLKSIQDVLNNIDSKKNGFNILIKSDTDTLIKRINSVISAVTESLINDLVLHLLEERL